MKITQEIYNTLGFEEFVCVSNLYVKYDLGKIIFWYSDYQGDESIVAEFDNLDDVKAFYKLIAKKDLVID